MDDGFNADADLNNNNTDPHDPRHLRDPPAWAGPNWDIVDPSDPEAQEHNYTYTIPGASYYSGGPTGQNQSSGSYTATNAYIRTVDVDIETVPSNSGDFSPGAAKSALDSVDYHRKGVSAHKGWQANGVNGFSGCEVTASWTRHAIEGDYDYEDRDGNHYSGTIIGHVSTGYLSSAELDLGCNEAVDPEEPVSATYVLVKTVMDQVEVGQSPASPQITVLGSVTLRITSGARSNAVELSSGLSNQSNIIQIGTAGEGRYVKLMPPAPIQGKIITMNLLPIDIEEISERDQKWNKAPSPKHTATNFGYDDHASEGAQILTRTLFVAVEPNSDKVEINIKGAGQSSSFIKTLVGVRSHSGNLLSDVASMNGGVVALDFTPAHGIDVGRHEVCIGIDRNSDGILDTGEIIELPQDKKFWIRTVTSSDYWAAYNQIDLWQGLGIISPAHEFSTSVLQYILGVDSTLDQATNTTLVTVPINRVDLTHIAGSVYSSGTGSTVIDQFHLPDGSEATSVIESTLNIETSAGLRGVLDQTWVTYRAQSAQKFQADPELETWSSGPLNITPSNGQFNGSAESFNIPEDLRLSIGTATITGTINFTLQRNPNDAAKFYLKQANFNCVVTDVIDYDWTRGLTARSRPASILQIGWQLPERDAGRVFGVQIEVIETYFTSDLVKFNAFPGSGTTPPSGGD